MSVYSFSQIWVYKQCPKRYQYQYIDKLEKEFISSPDLILWTSVHESLERLYQQVNIFKLPSKEDILNKFHNVWNNEINKIWDELYYKWDQSADDYIRRWDHYLNNYYDKYYPFDWIKIIWTEVKLYFSLDLNNPWKNNFYWIIDRLDKQWDTYIINDYKTNKNLPPEDKQDYREQLTLYALWVQQKYWKYLKNIKAKLHFLHFDELDEWDINDKISQPIIEKYSKLINEIESKKAKYAESFYSDKNIFPTNSNNFCKFCEYQIICPLFIHKNFWDEMISWWSLWESSIKKLVDRYVELSTQTNELNKEKDSIKDVLIEYANEKNFEQLYWNKNTLWLSESINYSAKNKNEFIEYLKEKWLFEKASDIPYYKINSLVKDWNLSGDTIEKHLEWKKSWKLTIKKNNDN